jgi:hypothetical protein
MMRQAAAAAAFVIGAQLAACSAIPVASILSGAPHTAGTSSEGATAASGTPPGAENGPGGQVLDRSASVAFTIVRDETAFATWSSAPPVLATPGPSAGAGNSPAGSTGSQTGTTNTTQTAGGENYLAIATWSAAPAPAPTPTPQVASPPGHEHHHAQPTAGPTLPPDYFAIATWSSAPNPVATLTPAPAGSPAPTPQPIATPEPGSGGGTATATWSSVPIRVR